MTATGLDSLVAWIPGPLTPVVIVVPGWVVAVVSAGALAIAIWRWRSHDFWEAVEVEVNFADLGKVKIKPNLEDIQIAHRAWVELATRKAGVPFDPEHDVIVDVYDSWYDLFGQFRELASSCPATKMRSHQGTRELVSTLAAVLNQGLRPHLTQWQAGFRRWYAFAAEDASHDESPQQIQRQYPDYEDLVADLQRVQEGLRRYMELLRQLATGER
ncbi:hypothetical protein V3331_02555 [Gaopeijia maritima]|uniref:hypothetical protein n=1 Tax=Gaopeijia maritima TaxID=3119007 RepID=UPI00325433B6